MCWLVMLGVLVECVGWLVVVVGCMVLLVWCVGWLGSSVGLVYWLDVLAVPKKIKSMDLPYAGCLRIITSRCAVWCVDWIGVCVGFVC